MNYFCRKAMKCGKILGYAFNLLILQSFVLMARTITFNKNTSMMYQALWPNDVTYSANYTLLWDEFLSGTHRAIFDTTGVVLDGGGYRFSFPASQEAVVVVNDFCAVTIQNILLDNLEVANISLGSGSSLTFGNNTVIQLKQNQVLTTTWKFSGVCSIVGQNNSLDLASGVLQVQAGATLNISNLTLSNVSTPSITCLSSASSINFNNVRILMSGNCNFTTGTFSVTNKLNIGGPYTFSMQTSLASTIYTNSELIIEPGTVFSYAPTVANQNLLILTDKSSKLSLIEATMNVTTTGLRLSKGTLWVDGASFLTSAATVAAEGVYFGDGASSANDLTIDTQPAASLTLTSGQLIYDNLGG